MDKHYTSGPGPKSFGRRRHYKQGDIVRMKPERFHKIEYYLIVDVEAHSLIDEGNEDGWWEYSIMKLDDGKIQNNIDATYFDRDTELME